MRKIFNCGLPKTGTSSLHGALLRLGIRSIHSANVGLAIRNWCLADSEFPPELENYEAFSDGPLCEATLSLLEKFPECKVIITKRNFESWLDSVFVHILANRLGATPGNIKLYDTTSWQNTYTRAHEIYALAEKIYPERTLVFNLEEGDSWEKLLPFLGISEKIFEPFPYENTSRERLEKILQILCARENP